MVPIQFLSVGEACRVTKIRGNDEVRTRLTGLGFVEGALVSVVGKTGKGMILSLGDARLALDEELSSRIMVLPVSACEASHLLDHKGGEKCEESASDQLWQHS